MRPVTVLKLTPGKAVSRVRGLFGSRLTSEMWTVPFLSFEAEAFRAGIFSLPSV